MSGNHYLMSNPSGVPINAPLASSTKSNIKIKEKNASPFKGPINKRGPTLFILCVSSYFTLIYATRLPKLIHGKREKKD